MKDSDNHQANKICFQTNKKISSVLCSEMQGTCLLKVSDELKWTELLVQIFFKQNQTI